MKEPANAISRYVIPDFFENPIIRPYLSNVRNWQGYIRFLGLPDRRENPDILIDRLFVEPLLTHRYVSPDENPTDWSREATTLLDALEACKALMILGDPGIGKSTLLNHVAWLLSRPDTNSLIERLGWALPLPMVLRELPIRGVTDFDGLLSAFLGHTMSAPLNSDGGEYLRQSLAEGKTFLLLDGIDEVGDQGAREDLRKAVLDGLDRYPHCHWLLSSRIVGYDEVPFYTSERDVESRTQLERERSRESGQTGRKLKEEGIATCYVAPFDDRRITAFAHNWYSQRDAAPTRASENANHLVQAIHADESICRLARVPNLLTMMALIHRIEATLPHGRALLYERITEAYLESIDKFRGIDSSPHDLPRKKGWLARVGLEMQKRRTSRDDPRSAEILVDLDTVKIWLREEMERGDTRQESPSAHEFLQIVARRSGLFLPRGENRYAFVHLSFQEYFAAVALVREVTRFNWAKNRKSRLGFSRGTLKEWAGKSVWRETFSFVFELLTSQDEDDWHDDLLKCVFGDNFRQLNVSSPFKKYHERHLNLGRLLARLVVNSRSGLSHQKRNDAIAACIGILYRVQPKNPETLLFPDPDEEASWNILKDLLGNDPEIDAKVFSEIGVQMEQVGASVLSLRGTRVSDLVPLANLTSLKWLYLSDARVSDLSPLANLTSLKWLDLDDTQISDLVPLANLTSLERLELRGTQVSDLVPLANLTALERLELSGTQVSDLVPLANLTSLEWLDLSGTQVSDLVPLANLTSLERLELRGTQVSDLVPLANLTALENLELGGTQVSDLALLANLTSLERLELRGAQVSDFALLANLTSLEWLDLSGTQVSDLVPLTNLTSLKWLELGGTQVSDLALLTNLTALENLELGGTQVSDLVPLANLTSLEWLHLSGTQVSDLVPLANLTSLEWLDLRGTQVSDLVPLANLTSLKWLYLSGTQVSDLVPLANLTSLERLELRGTQVSFSSVDKLRKFLPSLRILF